MYYVIYCALGKGKVDVERSVISYITSGRLYTGIYRPVIKTTRLAESNVSQLLQQVGLDLGFRGHGNSTLPPSALENNVYN